MIRRRKTEISEKWFPQKYLVSYHDVFFKHALSEIVEWPDITEYSIREFEKNHSDGHIIAVTKLEG